MSPRRPRITAESRKGRRSAVRKDPHRLCVYVRLVHTMVIAEGTGGTSVSRSHTTAQPSARATGAADPLRVILRRLFALAVVPAAALVFAVPASAEGNSLGPPGRTIYAFDVAYRTVATPTSLPDNGPTDTIYVFPDCASCASVSEAAPGSPGYNGGRWRVVQAWGITSQLTNADDVAAAASALTDTGIRFICPLINA